MKSFFFRTALAFAASLLALSSPCATERALLANPAGATLAAASAGDRALAGKLARLRTIAQESGSTRLIIGVRAAFAPEEGLAGSQALAQRIDIGNAQAAALQRLADAHGGNKPSTRFETIPFLALEATSAEFDTLASDSNVLSIEEDLLRRTTLAESSPLIGATASSAAGHDGSGQVVAILDTGVDKTHTFLSGKVVAEACYSSNVTSYSSTTVCPGGATDSIATGSGVNCGADCDHGTHVAGIVAGSGASFSGVARGVNLIAVQVFSRFTSTTYCGGAASCVMSYTSDQIKGLERVYALRGDYSIAAVNMSLGGGRYTNQATCDSDNSSIKAVIDNLRAAGIATVISSGNSGYTDSMGAPGCISTAISVGSTWDAAGLSLSCEASSTVNKVACYSNSVSFLNLLAPGSAINSSIPGGAYSVYHGTSMAAPQVTGAWAVLKQVAPGISVTSALNTLTSTGVSVTDTRNSLVKKRIDLVAALASLNPAATYTLTVNSSGAGGVAIGASPSTYAGTTNYGVIGIASGTSLTLTAPSTVGSATFSNWSGCDSGSGVTCTVTMNAAKMVTAGYSTLTSQTIAFGTAPTVAVGGTGTVSATATSGLPVTFSSLTTSICTVSGSTVTGLAAGTCTIAANQAGNGSYNPAPQITQSLTVVAPTDDSFPGGDSLPAGWTQPSGSNAAWAVTSSAAYAGSQSLGSGIIGNSQKSEISYTANFAAGNISFARKVSSESGWDFLEFYIDDVLKGRWSGEMAWAVFSFPLAAGQHILLWRYTKDGSVSSGSDTAWIDSVLLPGTGAPASQTISFGAMPTVVVGGTGALSATASSGLPVTFSSQTTGICTVSGSTVAGVAAGICTIAANQAGNSGTSAAPQVTSSFNITAIPPDPPEITSITAGSGSATIHFSAPGNTGGAPISRYTATCTAGGQPTRTASGAVSPITVRNLTGGVIYQCALTATNEGGGASAASAPRPVTPMPGKKSSLAPILMLLLD